MAHQVDFSSGFLLKLRTKRVHTHPISANLARAKQGILTIRSARNSPSFWEDDMGYSATDKPLNPYARAFVILWLLGTLAVIGTQYL